MKWSVKEWSDRSMRRPQYAVNDDKPARRRTKKNTKKWCKGIPGREHAFTWKIDASFLGYPWNREEDSRRYLNSCDLCGKHGEWGYYIICVKTERDRKWVETRMAGKWSWW